MQKFNKRSKRNLRFGFGIGLIILLLSSGLSYFSIKQLLESQYWVAHTTEVKSALDNLISEMKDAETGQRGFLLTGDEEFLEPYNGAREQVLGHYYRVKQLTIDNRSQQKDLPLLEKLIAEKFSTIDQTIRDKRRGIPPSITTLLRGKAIMDSTRVMVKNMNARENQLMVLRSKQMSKFTVFTPIVICVAALIGMILTVIFYRKVQADARISANLENELALKQQNTERQIATIEEVAGKISAGNYHVRVDKADLE